MSTWFTGDQVDNSNDSHLYQSCVFVWFLFEPGRRAD